MSKTVILIPKLIRQRDAPSYLSISEPFFNQNVRPYLTEIRQGRAILYDRLDIDDWADKFKAANGKPGKPMEDKTWQNLPPVLEKKATSGTLTKPSLAGSFEKALANLNSKQRSAT